LQLELEGEERERRKAISITLSPTICHQQKKREIGWEQGKT
jgi:hypothetical protein